MRIEVLKKGAKGFSLVELMVVVAIIGILAALAVPKFQNFQAKAKQSEAKSNLSHIYTLEQTYSAENDTYLANLTNIGFMAEGMVRYNYTATVAANTFTATATATSNAVIRSDCTFADTWTINQVKALMVVAGMDCAL
jgi:type IV pilus assembly protein PilA